MSYAFDTNGFVNRTDPRAFLEKALEASRSAKSNSGNAPTENAANPAAARASGDSVSVGADPAVRLVNAAMKSVQASAMKYVALEIGVNEKGALEIKGASIYAKAAAKGQEVAPGQAKEGAEGVGGTEKSAADDLLAALKDFFSPEKVAQRIFDFATSRYGIDNWGGEDTQENRQAYADWIIPAIDKGFADALSFFGGDVPGEVAGVTTDTRDRIDIKFDAFVRGSAVISDGDPIEPELPMEI